MTDSRLSREDFIQRHLPFNTFAFLVDGAGWWLGMSFFSVETILPYFVRELGGGDLLIGLIPALFSLGFFLPQIFIAPLTERRTSQKRAVMALAWIERAPLGLLAPLTMLLAVSTPRTLLVVFFACLGTHALMQGINTPGYSTMLTKSIPADRRGRLWGISIAIGGVIGTAGAGLSAWLLRDYGMPAGFALCFFICFVVLMGTVVPLAYVREPESLPVQTHESFRSYWTETKGLLGRYPGFRRLVITEWLFAIAAMAPAFYTVYARERLGAGPAQVGLYTMMQIGGAMVGGFLWGVLSDRRGNRLTLLSSALFMAVAPLWALFVPSLALFPVVFVCSSLARTGFDVGYFNIVLEYSGETKVATFQGVRAVVVMGIRVLSPMIGGAVAGGWGYPAVFGIGVAGALLAAMLVFRVPDPRFEPVGHA